MSELLTVPEIAVELRCSKAHAYKLIRGLVSGVPAIPSIPLGRRRLVRREALNSWIKSLEGQGDDAMIPPPEINAVGRVGGDHA